MSSSWQEIVADKKARQLASIPKEWILSGASIPPPDQLDVSGFPEACGLLSPREIDITNSLVDILLPKLASGEWSAVEVTTAFSKRAVIAHQLVSVVFRCSVLNIIISVDQLSYRDFY